MTNKMVEISRPMLAGTIENINTLTYPLIVSKKLDGIRCLKINGEILSRSFKQIPNEYINRTLKKLLPDGIDGEILVGKNFQECTHGVMSFDGEPDFTYWAFDFVTGSLNEPYQDRIIKLHDAVQKISDKRIKDVPHRWIKNADELSSYEEYILKEGFEGVMVRSINGPYKCGRSTLNEGYLLKLKRFVDSEAEILGLEEMFHNANEAKTNELGRTHRSSAQDGKIPMGKLGKFLVRDLKSGVEFSVGTGIGLTMELRQEIWDHQKKYVGKIIKYKSQPFGVKDAPRIPVFIGFRDKRDM